MVAKDKMMNKFEDRVKIEAQIKDCTQVCIYRNVLLYVQ